MKSLAAFALTMLAAAAVAQDAAKPKFRESDTPAPAPAPAVKDAAPKDGIGLIPETLEPVQKPKGVELKEPEAPQTLDKTTAAADELNERIRFRELKTKAEREPKVAAEMDRANTAKSDFEKREALRSYYALLYGRIAKLDSSLKKRADDARVRLSRRLDQTRVAPTEPIEPGERISE
ncbi:MAG: hypothetical protein ABMA13_17080 [Chthoniobacteraceae bacterium]